MKTVIPYETALARHPEAVAEILAKLKKGKSREKDAPPEAFEWSYQSWLQCDGSPLPVAGPERTTYFLSRTGAGLRASKRNWCGDGFLPKGYLPPEIIALYTERERKDVEERAHFDALTPEARDAEVEGLLRQLRKYPGFIEMQIPIPRR